MINLCIVVKCNYCEKRNMGEVLFSVDNLAMLQQGKIPFHFEPYPAAGNWDNWQIDINHKAICPDCQEKRQKA